MKAVLISGSYKKISIPKEIIEFIKKHIKDMKIMSFIATDFSNHISTEKFANKLINLFAKDSIVFEKTYIIDSLKSKEEMHLNLKESNIIFLLGGDTLKQIKNINKYSLKKLINNDKNLVLGISAGAINLADKVVLAKDESDNIKELSIYDGIGISKINIEPHCDFKNKKHFLELEEASLYSPIVLMNDDCFIIIEGDKTTYYGSYVVLDKKELFYNNKKCSLDDFLLEINYDKKG